MTWNLGNIIGKNFKILWRSKVSALSIVIIPLVVVLLVGIAFSSSSFSSISIASYSEDYNNLSESALDTIQEKGYETKKYPSESKCEKSVKDGETKICIIFPGNLSIENNESIFIYADKSRTDIAYYLINTLQSQISEEASGIGEIEVQKLINTVKSAKEIISTEKEKISDLKEDMDSAESSASSISGQNVDTDSLISSIENLNSSLDDIDNQSSLVNEMRDDLDDAMSDIEEMSSSFSEISESSDEISSKISNAKQKLSQTEDSLDNLLNELESADILEAEKIVDPLNTQVKSLKPNSSNWDYLFPKFIFIVILFCGIILASALIVREKKTGAVFRNSITSTRDFTFVIGTYITCLIILFLQLAIVLAGVQFIIGTSLHTMVAELALAVVISSSIFIFLGMLIGYAFISEETTMIVSISLIALFLFFSNAIFPIEAISGSLKNIIQYNPAAVSNTLFRKIILFNYDIFSVAKEFYILGGSLIISLFLALGVKKVTKRRV